MKKASRLVLLITLLAVGALPLCFCDSGEKTVDELTGNRAVKQYHRSVKDIEKITEQQTRSLETIPQEEEDKK